MAISLLEGCGALRIMEAVPAKRPTIYGIWEGSAAVNPPRGRGQRLDPCRLLAILHRDFEAAAPIAIMRTQRTGSPIESRGERAARIRGLLLVVLLALAAVPLSALGEPTTGTSIFRPLSSPAGMIHRYPLLASGTRRRARASSGLSPPRPE